MAGRIIHNLGIKALGNRNRPKIFQGPDMNPERNHELVRQKTGQEHVQRRKSEYDRLKNKGWTPRLLLDPSDPWIKRERRLGIQQIRTTTPFDPETGSRLDGSNQVLVWSKPITEDALSSIRCFFCLHTLTIFWR